MRGRRIRWLAVLACSVWTWSAADIEFHIAPDGDDASPGTAARPFASLERARDAIRAFKQGGPLAEPATVWLHEGIYERAATFELGALDSGAPQARVVYRAQPDADVRVIGGRIIPPSAAVPIQDAAVRDRIIEPEARTRVLQIDLKALGIDEYGEMRARGFRRPYIPAPLEVFIDGQALRLARWPNEGTVPIGEVIDPGSVPRDEDFTNRGGCFSYGYERPGLWTQAGDIWLSGLFGYGFADDTIRVAAIDTEKKTIAMAQPHMYGIKTGRPWHAYYALNLLEEIDLPGEYYVDRAAGILYFYPPRAIDGADIAVSIVEEPLIAMEGASYVSFQGITFEATRGMGVYIERGAGNLIAGCTLRNMGIVAVCMGMGIEPDTLYRHEMTGEPASRQLGSWHEHIYANSVFDRQAGTSHGVIGCDIYGIGAGAVHLGGGDRRTLEAAGNYVRNCHIYDFNRLDKSYKAAVNIDGVGNCVQHCLIHDCPNSALYLHGNDHVIEYNEVHHACLDADDMGVFYMGRDPSEQGNVIRYNFWHHNGNDHGSTCVVYFDDDACGTAVMGNVFYANKGRAVWINHGCDHWFDGSVFIENEGAVPACQDTRAYDWASDELQHKRLRVDLDITAPPYSVRYPHLLDTYNTPMGRGRGSYVFRNVSVRSGVFDTGTNILAHNAILDTDAGFVDAGRMDFQFRDDSPVWEQVPGFARIPLERIGLYRGEYRVAVPVDPP
ncbi:MAG: right-handed parallel beta-helix repeat-containing protein, partial [Candidatus Hydrogenedentes bacterium]|nr:right-handed parallel beta-helix repeat-containing protein [Candidatus Hydrogenedentota bacterium]